MLALILACGLFLLFACTSTKPSYPNQRYDGAYPEGFNIIEKQSPLLAIELGKIPEFQDGISLSESETLNNLTDFYTNNPEVFDNAFKEMYQVGLSNIRKFNSPLQAVFWIYQRGHAKKAAQLIRQYTLKSLLDESWKLYAIADADKWNDFQTVVYRLNSPELLDYYQRRTIRYKYERGYGETSIEARRVFKNKYGHCAQITAFTVYVLRTVGYEAGKKIISEPSLRSPRGNDHRVTLFLVNDTEYFMDNGRKSPFGIMRAADYDAILQPYQHKYQKVWNEMN